MLLKQTRTLLILTFALCIGVVNVNAQKLTKKEAKKIKKEIKRLSPQQYLNLKESANNAKTEISDLNKQVASLEEAAGEKDSKIEELTNEVRSKEDELNNVKSDLLKLQSSAQEASQSKKYDAGVNFRVQIGAFRNKDLSKYFNNNSNFSGEVDDEGTQKVTLGVFGDYWEADTFKKYLREMGVSDAWIVSYRDGQRVPLKDVLEGVVEGGK